MKNSMKIARSSILALPIALIGGAAFAGGLSEPIVTPAPTPVAPVPVVSYGSDWTGFYAGAQVGYGELDADTLDDDTNGATYGVHAGYLYDLGSVVLGGEIDYDGTNIEDETNDVQVDSIARVKLRAGYDAGNWMPYITVGGAKAFVTDAGTEVDDTGAFAGLGVDYRMSNTVRVGAEVLQHQFEDFNGSGTDIDATTAAVRVSFQF